MKNNINANNVNVAKPTSTRDLANVMLLVLFALIPGTLAWVYYFGTSILVTIVIAISSALAFEALMLKIRRRPVKMFLQDYSAIVTAVLLALCLPPYTPWWLIVIAIGFAIIIAKHLYGGLGQNPFNPAMIGYVVVLISFPASINQWSDVNQQQRFDTKLAIKMQLGDGHKSNKKWFDSVSSATPLNRTQEKLDLGHTLSEIYKHPSFDSLLGGATGTGWKWINIMFLMGGLALISLRLISWHIPVAMLGTITVISLLFNVIDSDIYHSPLFHLFGGGTMLAAFFIATDPVTACTTPKGKILFGVGVGLFT